MSLYGKFITDPGYSRSPRGRVVLLDPLRYISADDELFIVPDGFISDGASIPSPAWVLVGHPMSGILLRPALLHDYECRVRIHPAAEVHRRFYNALRSEGVGWFRAHVIWRAVDIFGPHWTKEPYL